MDDDKNAMSRLGAIKEFAIDYSQSLTELGQYKKFKESFMKSAGVSDIEKIGTAISKAGYLSEILYNGINLKKILLIDQLPKGIRRICRKNVRTACTKSSVSRFDENV